MKPTIKPENPNFSSGPCSKRPGWNVSVLSNALVGRSHRSGPGRARLGQVIDETREFLNIPADYRIGIVPASDTGAVEMMLWSLLGPKEVDVFSWESFSATWLKDITQELKLENVNSYTADYGQLPDMSQANPDNDIVFAFNGTTSGVRVPNLDWISDSRNGLSICDATSAVFSMSLDWDKLDVTTWSWQKALGGEGQHGMVVLSPRAVERLENHTPTWPMPKIFRLTKKGKINEAIFKGDTINTPSMLCVEDVLDSLSWGRSIGGQGAFEKRSLDNFKCVQNWANNSNWIKLLAEAEETQSCTSICLKITDEKFLALDSAAQKAAVKQMLAILAEENAALDVGSYRDAPIGLRLWGGATIETSDLESALPWLDWAFSQLAL